MSNWTSKKIMETYPNKKKFLFYIITESGEKVVWENMSETMGCKLNVACKLYPPSNILKFGYCKMPEAPKENKE